MALEITCHEASEDDRSTGHPRICHAISHSTFSLSLREIVLGVFVAETGVPPILHPKQSCVLLDSVRSLLGLRWLRKVHLAGYWSDICVNDVDILTMAKAWPKLEYLHLQILHMNQPRLGESVQIPPHPSVTALVHLARQCRKLARLTMPIDFEHEDGFGWLKVPVDQLPPPHHEETRNSRGRASGAARRADEGVCAAHL
ncbi:hypothetical protein BD310DRAFT_824317 [Dichomitus squalens]|uniref:F-box domain-containing protein n=1 Tax=Dichomitus squalens TaxID=114155 RepID=A0A4Q9PPT7_9APHY|nr:hypothetical protein BD310DRAFT_824317 [Dichomitus squalens]